MSNYFTKNKKSIARVATNDYGSNTLIIIVSVFSLFTLGLGILVFIPIYFVKKLRKKTELYELGNAYAEIIGTNHKKLEIYLDDKINNDDLIADPIFIFETSTTGEQTINKLKNAVNGKIDNKSVLTYLKSNQSAWTLNIKDEERNFILASPFTISMLLFCEHKAIIVSQTCTLPLCIDMPLDIKEISYFQTNYGINNQTISLGEFVSQPMNIEVTTKIHAILTALKPYIES